ETKHQRCGCCTTPKQRDQTPTLWMLYHPQARRLNTDTVDAVPLSNTEIKYQRCGCCTTLKYRDQTPTLW
ncbi:hypothetical protein NDU88_000895, partial [Pleurodeles waltl]